MTTPTKPFQPFVPEHVQMKELTLRALLLGLTMTVVLGAANAYLGLRAGITVAATYPAAVISMAAMRAWRGSLLEENIARTSGSIGEGVASGGGDLYDSSIRACACVAVIWIRRCVLEIDGIDSSGQRVGRAVHIAGAAPDGG